LSVTSALLTCRPRPPFPSSPTRASAITTCIPESRQFIITPTSPAARILFPATHARHKRENSRIDGGYAEYCCIRSENAVHIETSQSDAELATYPCAYTTAENLVSRSGLRPGECVVIAGASGGVGSAAIQLCRLRGARVIAIASSAKSELLKQLGADQVIDRNTTDLEQAIADAAQSRVDVALDVVGGSMFMPLINSLRQGGRYSSSGSIAGPLVEFDLRQLVYRDLQLTGATIVPPGTMHRLVSLIEQGLLKPLLAHAFPLEDLGIAQEMFMQKQHVGNIVVKI
jgi:NADPH:quinone reductase-like Zn-dependent oxidoreductase